MFMARDYTICAFCRELANLNCQRCFESYCSEDCQLADWPQHKLICIPIPPLIPKETVEMIIKKTEINYISNSLECNKVIVKNENLIQSNFQNRQLPDNVDNQNGNISNDGNKAISVRIHDDILTKIDNIDINCATNMNKSENIFKKSDRSMHIFKNVNNIESNSYVAYKTNISDRINKYRDTYKIRNDNAKQIHPKLLENTGFKKDYGIVNNNTSSSFKPVILEKSINSYSSQLNNNPIRKSIENIKICSKPWKIPFPFPKGKTVFKVIVQFVDKNAKLIWLTDISLETEVTKLLKQINENIQYADKTTTDDINIDNIVAAPFTDGLHYRAIILDKINPKNIVRLRLVDYGNDFEIDINKLKLPIPIMKNLNAFAFCCRYNKSAEIGKILNIRVVGQEFEEIFIIEEIQKQ